MTIEELEREEQDRIQYEMQLAGQGGKRWGMFSSGKNRRAKVKPRAVKVESTENYRLTLANIKR
jgi:hypothetical protein